MIAFTIAIGRAVRAAEATDFLPSDTPRPGGGMEAAVVADRRPIEAGSVG